MKNENTKVIQAQEGGMHITVSTGMSESDDKFYAALTVSNIDASKDAMQIAAWMRALVESGAHDGQNMQEHKLQ